MNKTLSKTSYLQGLKCERFLWLNHYNKDAIKSLTLSNISRIDSGRELGALARKMFPDGLLVPDSIFDLQERLDLTAKWMKEGVDTIFEATFLFNDVQVRIDILNKTKEGYNLYEVKEKTWKHTSKLTQKDFRKLVEDVSIQMYVLHGLGIQLNQAHLTLLDSSYALKSELDLTKLFINIPVTEASDRIQQLIPINLSQYKGILSNKNEEPPLVISSECKKCKAKEYCWKVLPEYNVFHLLGIRKSGFELYNQGIISVEDISDDNDYSEDINFLISQWKDKPSPTIDKEQIGNFLDSLVYPLFHLDFETFGPPVPLYENTSPFQAIAFQYSLHIEQKDESLEHKEFLGEPANDPREGLIENLIIDLEGESSIIVYSGYEKTILKKLAKNFPKYESEIESIINRLKDFALVFKERYFYSWELRGSHSLKQIMPLMVPEMSTRYKDLSESGAVSEGDGASMAFRQLIIEKDSIIINKIRSELLEYCKLDTEAMVQALRSLRVYSQ